MPGVHQVVASLAYGDAIGNHARGIQRALRKAGYASEIYVESADPRVESLTRDYRELVDDIGPDDILIHHFSIGSRASRTAYAVAGRMILVYHNITPPQYFLGEHSWLVQQCYHGRRELLAYRTRVDLALGASEFNRQELEVAGFPATGVLPVVPDFSHLGVTPDERIYNSFDDETTNVLFVGRLIGNKRPDNLIRYVHAYRKLFNADARLIIAGSHDHFAGYLAELHAFAAHLGATNVHLLGQVTNEQLTALYDVADVFLCASEHEGFCVPIVEAFYKRVPVIARAAAAVPATMDGGGILYETEDPAEVAGLIDAVASDEQIEEQVLAAQDAALTRMLSRDFESALLGFVRQVSAAPPREAPVVDPDFWRQFRLADELEAIRETRPSAFHALPAEPSRDPLVAHVGDRR